MADMDLIDRLKEFIENEAHSGSMDFGCISSLGNGGTDTGMRNHHSHYFN